MIEMIDAGRVRLLGLAADVDLARGIFADQYDREAGNDGLARECGGPLGDTAAQVFGNGFAVDDRGGQGEALSCGSDADCTGPDSALSAQLSGPCPWRCAAFP